MNSLGIAIRRFWQSSIGKKVVVALTGAVLVLFLLGHLTGNMLMYVGRDAMNDYAELLKHLGHGAMIWVVRAVLLTCFLLHIVATISLTRMNRAARGDDRYECKTTVQASKSSRIMIWSGLTVLAFVVFHILHFTVRIDPDLANMHDPDMPERHDVFGMVLAGFQNPLVVLFYIVGITLLCSHLSHGIASVFQTLGIRSEKVRDAEKKLGMAVAIVLWIGFLTIPICVISGVLGDPPAKSSESASVETSSSH